MGWDDEEVRGRASPYVVAEHTCSGFPFPVIHITDTIIISLTVLYLSFVQLKVAVYDHIVELSSS